MSRPETALAPDEDAYLSLSGLTKRFGGVQALAGAKLLVRKGEIHGLVGQNGAGKSTMIKILAGLVQADAGQIHIGGRDLADARPRDVEAAGIHFIHQERMLVPDFTVAEALFLGHEVRLGPFLARRRMQASAQALMQRYFGRVLPGNRLIAELSTGEQQIVQIVRALLQEPQVLVLDEPTAALVRAEIDHLFEALNRLRAGGMTVVYISHYLSEIEALCDRVTVLRNGQTVATVDPRHTSSREIASLMVARDLNEMFPARVASKGRPVLSARALGDGRNFQDVTFTLHAGEVLGLTGLQGSGAKELLRSLFGLDRITSGEVSIEDRPFRARSPREAAAQGVAFVPEDRRHQGAILEMSIAANMTLANLARFSWRGLLRPRLEREVATRMISELAIKAEGPDAVVASLSGGNQQKVVLAKWLTRAAPLYILDEPTLGVDVAAKIEIYELVQRLARDGAAILVLSNDLDELVGITHRILVMYRGRTASSIPAATTSPAALLDVILTGQSEIAHVVH
ncbi:monosaccharide ABC transporter ATP-binding protein, CUT2 family [Arboricoccus pini]|uniref:Monosaccharide ABC transporter ATP-binding protein, CUT2 family n=1 Tax=Arboricoccus pini TaxID=1963835 RepID=A0A212S3A9_9PROT|nr:sugar ABC transporter ATP-binding protein [Arboricoccus pini]SNB79672.1 monosaccharide ABC transporter ATP-binding protein, CUT2 family [Arboricoccus pini]